MTKETTKYNHGVEESVYIPNIPKMPFPIATGVLWRNKNKK